MDGALSITTLNTYIKARLEGDPELKDVWLCGEISDCRYYARAKQYYLSLRDTSLKATATLSAVIYESVHARIGLVPTTGMKVVVRGTVLFYQNKGTVMFRVAYMMQQGTGKHLQERAALKKQFEKEGLLDPAVKQALPLYPETIGLITALHSAAMGDFIATLRKDNRYSRVLVFPSTMQGDTAVWSLMEQLERAQQAHVSCIALVRGGGSAQDLRPFDHEQLCRAIAAATCPVITGIGHQTDLSLADEIADMTAHTPTACAALLTQPFIAIKQKQRHVFNAYQQHIAHALIALTGQIRAQITQAKNNVSRLVIHCSYTVERMTARVVQANPLAPFLNGYTQTLQQDGTPITTVSGSQKGDTLITQLPDGQLESKLTRVMHGNKKNHNFIANIS